MSSQDVRCGLEAVASHSASFTQRHCSGAPSSDSLGTLPELLQNRRFDV